MPERLLEVGRKEAKVINHYRHENNNSHNGYHDSKEQHWSSKAKKNDQRTLFEESQRSERDGRDDNDIKQPEVPLKKISGVQGCPLLANWRSDFNRSCAFSGLEPSEKVTKLRLWCSGQPLQLAFRGIMKHALAFHRCISARAACFAVWNLKPSVCFCPSPMSHRNQMGQCV